MIPSKWGLHVMDGSTFYELVFAIDFSKFVLIVFGILIQASMKIMYQSYKLNERGKL